MNRYLLLSLMLFLSIFQIFSMEKEKSRYNQFLNIGMQIYSPMITGTFAHEYGHYSTGKKLYNCKSFFWVTPWCSGATTYYHGNSIPKSFPIIYPIVRKMPQNLAIKFLNFLKYPDHLDIKSLDRANCRGIKGATVAAAGPLFGMAAAAVFPLANTFYHEYKDAKSFTTALKKTYQQPYFNNKQDPALLGGALLSFTINLANFIPYREEIDGARILEAFNLNKKAIRWPINGIALLTAGMLVREVIK